MSKGLEPGMVFPDFQLPDDNGVMHHLSDVQGEAAMVVMLGRGGGRIQTGRVLDYRDKPNRQMCRLYLSLMDKMNVRLDKFGDATEALAEV